MNSEELKNRNFEKEFNFSTSRSSGPGGQNVNKVSTKVELRFNLMLTTAFMKKKKNYFQKVKEQDHKRRRISACFPIRKDTTDE